MMVSESSMIKSIYWKRLKINIPRIPSLMKKIRNGSYFFSHHHWKSKKLPPRVEGKDSWSKCMLKHAQYSHVSPVYEQSNAHYQAYGAPVAYQPHNSNLAGLRLPSFMYFSLPPRYFWASISFLLRSLLKGSRSW